MAEEANEKYARYTDVEYLSQQGLREKLGTMLGLDYMWAGILEYRNRPTNRVNLPLRALGSSSLLHYTATSEIKRRTYGPFEVMFNDFRNKLREISSDRAARADFIQSARKHALLGADRLEKAGCGDATISAILGGYFHESDPKKNLIANYYHILCDFDEIVEENRAEDAVTSIELFLGSAMERLYGTEDLESFYRIGDPHKGYVTDSAPRFAQAATISSRMKALWAYLEETSDPSWLVALITAYYVRYVNPFDMEVEKDHNAILAILLARYALHESEFASICDVIPLEEILEFSDHFIRYEDVEIRKDGDLTYFLLDAIKKLSFSLENLLNGIHIQIKEEIAHEYRDIPEEEIPKPKSQEPSPEFVENWEDVAPAPKKVVSEKKEPKPEPQKGEVKDAAEFAMPDDAGEYALIPPKEVHSEKLNAQNKERARYVLETHPMLRKMQANFYATHCTLGRFYTIQDFKKATRCAYETARTSMELLASEGLYEKLHIKNKFVYTPVRQGGK